MKIAIVDIIANGIAASEILSMEAPPIPEATKRFSPRGGV